MSSPLLYLIFIFFIGAIVIILRVVAAKAVTDETQERNAVRWLRYNPFFKAYIATFFLAVAIQPGYLPPSSLLGWLPWLIVLWSLAVSLRTYSLKIGLTPDHLLYRLWGEKIIPWNEIEAVTFSYPEKGWLIETKKHGKLIVPTSLSGKPQLFEALENRGIPLH